MYIYSTSLIAPLANTSNTSTHLAAISGSLFNFNSILLKIKIQNDNEISKKKK